MKTELAAFELHALLTELDFLSGGKIEQIYQIAKEKIVLVVHAQQKRFLQIDMGKLFFLSLVKGDTPERPPGFCSYLRKYLKNARIQTIHQIGFERIIDIELTTKDKIYHLIIELIAPGNVLLCDENYLILSPLISAKYGERTIRPRVPYEHPEKKYNFLELTESDLHLLLAESSRDSLVTCLAIDLGLGGIYAEELCSMAKIEKEKKPASLSEEEHEMLFAAIELLRKRKIEPQLLKKGDDIVNILPIFLEHRETERAEQATYWETLADLLTEKGALEKEEQIEKEAKTTVTKIEERIRQQEQIIAGLETSERHNQKVGEAIYEHYQEIERMLKEIVMLKEKGGWEAAKEKYKVNEKTGELMYEFS